MESLDTQHSRSVRKNSKALQTLQVFVHIPHKKCTVPLELSGDESQDELRLKVQKLAKIPAQAAQTVKLATQGQALTSAKQLVAGATITLTTAGLLGGSKSQFGICYSDQPAHEYQIVNEKETFGEMRAGFEAGVKAEHPLKKLTEYKFSYCDVNGEISEAIPYPGIDEEADVDEWNAQQLNEIPGYKLGPKMRIKVVVESISIEEKNKVKGVKKEEKAEVQFLRTIPCYETAKVRYQLISKLDLSQKSRMEKFINHAMDRDDLESLLSVLTDQQMHAIMTRLTYTNSEVLLEYLLKNAGQWTTLSTEMNAKASKQTKLVQIRRLIGQIQHKFNPNDQNDDILAEIIIEEQKKVLGPIILQMDKIQRIEMLMIWLEPNQRIEVLRSLKPIQIRDFWTYMTKLRKVQIFSSLPPADQFSYLGSDQFLEAEQKLRLWDNLSKESRVSIWYSTSEEEVCNKFFESKRDNVKQKAMQQVANLLASFAAPGKRQGDIMTMEQKSQDLKIQLLKVLSMLQQASLWSILPKVEQNGLIKVILVDIEKTIAFFQVLPHQKRSLMVDQVADKDLKSMFKAMDIETRSQLLYMLNKETQEILKNELSDLEKRDLFYHGHFGISEKTDISSEKYVQKLVKEFYEQNNNVMPSSILRDSYRQVFANPEKSNGWIVVSIYESQNVVNNTVYKNKQDPLEQEQYSEEAFAFQADKKVRNDTMRFCQNHYGQIQEIEPDACRSSDQVEQYAEFAFFEYSEEKKGIWCTSSFFAPYPVIFNADSQAQCSQQIVLFQGLNGDVFFFNQVEKTIQLDMQCKSGTKKFELQLQIINQKVDINKGEQSRSTVECCDTFKIPRGSILFDFIMNGRFEMESYNQKVRMLNSMPTIITEGLNKYVAFSHCRGDKDDENFGKDFGPSLYFYDIQKHREALKISGGEALIDYKYNGEAHGQFADRLLFLGNKELMSEQGMYSEKITASKGELFLKSAIHESKTAIVIGLNFRISYSYIEHGEEQNCAELWACEDGRLIRRPDSTSQSMGGWIPKAEELTIDRKDERKLVVSLIDLKDEDHIFQQRYLRDTVVQIQPHRVDCDAIADSFTLLFRQVYSFTFSFIKIAGVMDKKTKAECQEEYEKMSKKITEEREKKTSQSIIDEMKEERQQIFVKRALEYRYFKCKYIVPWASEIIFDKRDTANVNTLVQVSNKNSHALDQWQNVQSIKQDLRFHISMFQINLYNITNTAIRYDQTEELPGGLNGRNTIHKVPVNSGHLRQYARNLYANKFGDSDIQFVFPPLAILQSGIYGSYMQTAYSQHPIQESNPSRWNQWFVAPNEGRQKDVSFGQEYHTLDYPYMVYKNRSLDNREIVLANLADKMQPQKIIHLVDKQLIGFVGHNFATRYAKIGMLCLQGDQFKLCWLTINQPYKKREMNELDYLAIIEIDVAFRVPIMSELSDIQAIEFVNQPNKSIKESNEGALMVQTASNIWFCDLASGAYQCLTNGKMTPVVMQRGYNSFFYYAVRSNETDVVVNEVKLELASQKWTAQIQEVLKVNEAQVIALEMDGENRSQTDSVYMYDRQTLQEENLAVGNIIQVIDDKETLWIVRQNTQEDSANNYEVIKELDLALSKQISRELNTLSKSLFTHVQISERSITFGLNTYSLVNLHSWQLNSQQPNKGTKYDLFSQKEIKGRLSTFENISWSNRQFFKIEFQSYDKETNKVISQYCYLTKLFPSTRRQDLIGLRGLRDVQNIIGISDDRFLMKIYGQSPPVGQNDYWTIIDKFGQILPIPAEIEEQLIWSSVGSGQSRMQRKGNSIVLIGGQEKILHFDTDVVWRDKQVTQIDFSRTGEVVQVKEFRKDQYVPKLKAAIQEQLQSESKQLFGQELNLGKDQVEAIADTLQENEDILVTMQGDLYRMASIVDKRFSDQATVNQFNDVDFDGKIDGDNLHMGIFVVNSKKQSEAQNISKIEKNNKSLKIILFLCKNEQERFWLSKAGFCIVGKYLCWSFPQESAIHFRNMDDMNQTKSKNAFVEGAEKIFNTFSKFPSMLQLNNSNEDDDFQRVGEGQIDDIPQQSSPLKRKVWSENWKFNDDSDNENAIESPLLRQNQQKQLIQETEQIVVDTEIQWKEYETKVIDLDIICGGSISEKQSMHIQELPKSTLLSIQQTGSVNEEPQLQENLLQVTIRDKSIVFDLAKEDAPQEKFFLNATNQFTDPQSNVDVGISLVHSVPISDTEYLMDEIKQNRSKDVNIQYQHRMVYEQGVKLDTSNREKPETQSIRSIFKSYAEQDIQEIARISQTLRGVKKLDNIDLQTLLSTFIGGHTAFSIFFHDVKFYEQVLTQVQEEEFEAEVQEDETELENSVLRRLFRILKMPVPFMEDSKNQSKKSLSMAERQETGTYESETSLATEVAEPEDKNEADAKVEETGTKEGLESVIQKSIYHTVPRIKDCLLLIANKCGECAITSFCENQQDFEKLIGNLNGSAMELINESFVNSIFTSKIMNTNWDPGNLDMYTFRRSRTTISQKEIDDEMMDFLVDEGVAKNQIMQTQVDVRMLDLSWMLKDRMNFVHFCKTLDSASSDGIYETEFISILLNEFWQENYSKIIWKGMIPWCVYASFTMCFFVYALNGEGNEMLMHCLAVVVFFFLTWMWYIEIRQFRQGDEGLNYFKDPVNLMDIFQTLSTVWIIVNHLLNTEITSMENQRVMAAFSTLFLWIKVLDWLKLFDSTSFFIKLIEDTIADIGAFMIIVVVALFMFGMPMFILQMNRTEDNVVVEEIFGKNFVMNAFYNQYMMSLGEFETETFGDGPQTYLCYIFLLAATFLTQITFLNMLVAVMGETYSMVMESQTKYQLLTQRAILTDYTALILDQSTQDNDRYLYVVTPKSEGGEGGNGWEGSLTVIKRTIDGGLSKLQKQIDKKIQGIEENLNASKTRDSRVEKESRGQYLRINEKFITLEKHLEHVDPEKTEKIFDIVKKSQAEQINNSRSLKDASEKIHEEQDKLLSLNERLNSSRQAEQSTDFMREIQELKQVASVAPAVPQIASDQEIAESESKNQAREDLATLVSQQGQMLRDEIKSLKTEQDQLKQTINQSSTTQSDFARVLAQLQSDQQTSTSSLMEQLRSLKDQVGEISQSSAQPASQGVDLAAFQAIMQDITTQMTTSQQQMQQTLFEQHQADKQEIKELIQKVATEQQDDF